MQSSRNFDRPKFKFTFREKSRKSEENPDTFRVKRKSSEEKERLDAPCSKDVEEEAQARSKLHKSDSFLRRLVRSSKDNITEGCERLVRNIQKSPLLRKKFQSTDEERPVAPVRRKKSKQRLLEPDFTNKQSSTGIDPEQPNNIHVSVVCPSAELIEDDFLLVHKEPQTERTNHSLNESTTKISSTYFVENEDSSKSVSVEDVEDLIRTENNLRLLEQRVLIRRRLEKSTKLLEALQSGQRRSWSEESLVHAIEQVHRKFHVGFPISKVSIDTVTVDCSPIAHRRFVRPICNRGKSSSGQSRSLEWRDKVEWTSWKAKRSPPPDDWQVQRSPRLPSRRDSTHGSGDNHVPARKSRIQGDEVHARLTSLVKCKLANFAGSGGDEEELRDGEPAEEQSKQRLVANRLDENATRHPSTPVCEPTHGSRVISDLRIESTSVNDALGDSGIVTIRVNLGDLESDARDDNQGALKSASVIIADRGKNNESKDQGRSAKKKKAIGSGCKVPDWNDWKMKFTIRMIRIRDKLMLGLSAFAILFTILLVMDLQMDLGYSGHHLVPSHGRVRVGDDPNTGTIYNFRRRYLQRTNASKEQTSGDMSGTTQNSGKDGENVGRESRTEKTEVHDNFRDLVDLVEKGYGVSVYEGVARISGEDHTYNPTIGEMKKISPK